MFKKIYKRLFIKNAVKLFICSANYKLINFFAVLFFSRARKPTKILMFTNRLLNKKICECYRLYKKCELLKNKILSYNIIKT
jgi:hypothetical protein